MLKWIPFESLLDVKAVLYTTTKNNENKEEEEDEEVRRRWRCGKTVNSWLIILLLWTFN